jgi:hypothetical protein
MPLSGKAATDKLHEAITAAKSSEWEELNDCIFSAGGGRALSDQVINTVPHPRAYGILHQIAYWGENDVYEALTAKGVRFDLEVRTKDGKTAEQVAVEEGKDDFAAVLAAAAVAGAAEPEPDGGALVQTTSQALVGDNLRKLSPLQIGALLRDSLPSVHHSPPSPAHSDELKTMVYERCIANSIGGRQMLEIIESNTVPGSSMEEHESFKALFDGTEELFERAVTSVRGATVFATLIINKLILANASASINQLEQAVFGPGMIPPDHRARQYDAWYPRDKVWCIEAGTPQPIEYDDSKFGGTGQASAVHGCYIAPAGWMRFAIDTTKYPSAPKPEEWSTWHKAYHGTAGANVNSIVQNSLKFMPSVHGAAGAGGKQVIYASPSIEYSAHYVYTTKGKAKGKLSFSAGGAGAAVNFEDLAKSALHSAGEGNYVSSVSRVARSVPNPPPHSAGKLNMHYAAWFNRGCSLSGSLKCESDRAAIGCRATPLAATFGERTGKRSGVWSITSAQTQ